MCSLVALIVAGALAVFQPTQVADTIAIGAALSHARTVVTEGDILVSPQANALLTEPPIPGSWIPEIETMESAARVAGLPYGPDRDAVQCSSFGEACRSQGTFRGVVYVLGIKLPSADSMLVTLQTYHFKPRPEIDFARDHVYDQVDEIHVARRGRDSEWRIVKVESISER